MGQIGVCPRTRSSSNLSLSRSNLAVAGININSITHRFVHLHMPHSTTTSKRNPAGERLFHRVLEYHWNFLNSAFCYQTRFPTPQSPSMHCQNQTQHPEENLSSPCCPFSSGGEEIDAVTATTQQWSEPFIGIAKGTGCCDASRSFCDRPWSCCSGGPC